MSKYIIHMLYMLYSIHNWVRLYKTIAFICNYAAITILQHLTRNRWTYIKWIILFNAFRCLYCGAMFKVKTFLKRNINELCNTNYYKTNYYYYLIIKRSTRIFVYRLSSIKNTILYCWLHFVDLLKIKVKLIYYLNWNPLGFDLLVK